MKRKPKVIRVRVTKRDIDNGLRGVCARCPVALALQRRIAPLSDTDGQRWYLGGGSYARPLPLAVSRFVRAYDWGRKVKPFTFTVRV